MAASAMSMGDAERRDTSSLMADISPPGPGRPYAIVTPAGEAGPLALDPAAIVALYQRHGALLLRGFALDLGAFRAFAGQFCSSSVFNESPDRRLLDAEANIQSVNGGVAAFPLHPELSREPWKPDVCFFACFRPPRAKGATTICDGIELVRHLPEAVRRGLERRRLLYVQRAAPELLDYWLGSATPDDALLAAPPPPCPYVFRRTPDGIVRAFSRPALHKPMFSDAPAFGNFLLFSAFFNGNATFPLLDDGQPVPEPWLWAIKDVGDRLSAPVAWQAGDLLMLDNSRFMHGRTAILDPDERQIASFFGYLNFAIPDAEEPPGAPWRKAAFRPPQRRAPLPA